MDTSKFLWDTPSHIRRNVRLMCDAAGLSVWMKNVLCACIKQESNYNPKAIGSVNKNLTRDFGLVQINNHIGYWIGDGLYFKDTNEVLNNPEKCVRFMISQFKSGHASYWSSFSSKAYLKWLPIESLPSVPY